MENNYGGASSPKSRINISCVIMIMQSEWWPVLQTKFNINIMVEIDIHILKALYKSSSVLRNSLACFLNKVILHAMQTKSNQDGMA